jgi:hypothetical protein
MEVFLMREKMLVTILFMLATLASAAQQPGQATAPESQAPGARQSQPSMPGSPDQNTGPGAQAAPQGPTANAPVTEGCLGGNDPNYTITDTAGTTYKLNIPSGADTSKLAQHVGESVQVAGNVNSNSKAGKDSIDVQGIGRGNGKCPAGGSTGAQSPPKQ